MASQWRGRSEEEEQEDASSVRWLKSSFRNRAAGDSHSPERVLALKVLISDVLAYLDFSDAAVRGKLVV